MNDVDDLKQRRSDVWDIRSCESRLEKNRYQRFNKKLLAKDDQVISVTKQHRLTLCCWFCEQWKPTGVLCVKCVRSSLICLYIFHTYSVGNTSKIWWKICFNASLLLSHSVKKSKIFQDYDKVIVDKYQRNAFWLSVCDVKSSTVWVEKIPLTHIAYHRRVKIAIIFKMSLFVDRMKREIHRWC